MERGQNSHCFTLHHPPELIWLQHWQPSPKIPDNVARREMNEDSCRDTGRKKKEERETTARLLRDERRTAFTLKCTNSSIFRLLFEIPHRQQSSDVSASEEDSLSDTTAAALICRCSGSCWRSEWITGCWRQTHSHRVCSTLKLEVEKHWKKNAVLTLRQSFSTSGSQPHLGSPEKSSNG